MSSVKNLQWIDDLSFGVVSWCDYFFRIFVAVNSDIAIVPLTKPPAGGIIRDIIFAERDLVLRISSLSIKVFLWPNQVDISLAY